MGFQLNKPHDQIFIGIFIFGLISLCLSIPTRENLNSTLTTTTVNNKTLHQDIHFNLRVTTTMTNNELLFTKLLCKGQYDKMIFQIIDKYCIDCAKVFQSQDLKELCRSKCYTSRYIDGCIDVVMSSDDREKIISRIQILSGQKRDMIFITSQV